MTPAPSFQSTDSDNIATSTTEYWLPQGNLARGRWRRWFRVSSSGDAALLGEELDQAVLEQMAQRESLEHLWSIVQERQYGKKESKLTVAQDPSNFAPVSLLESGVARSQAVCRIARYFSLEAFRQLLDSIQSSSIAKSYDDQELLTEIFTIPGQVAAEIFAVDAQGKPQETPLNALKKLNESHMSKLNPIPIGTGFLVGRTHLMTNNHVISDVTEASECVAQFNYVQDGTGQRRQTIDYEFDPKALFVTSAELDYTLVQLKSGMFTRQAGYQFGWLQLSGDETTIAPGLTNEDIEELRTVIGDRTKVKSMPGDRVFLIQHPKGQQKQIVQGDNRVLPYGKDGFLKSFIRYNAESDYGSSGSPVFNANWELVALHHAAIGKETKPTSTSATQPSTPEASTTQISTPPPSATQTPTPQPSATQPSATQTSTAGSNTDSSASTGSDKATSVGIEAYQGVRICRIVEDLQLKSFTLPKLQSFIEDFVITNTQLNNTSLPGALSFTRNGQYVSVDSSIGFLTGSTDGSIKVWNRAGLEVATVHLEVERESAAIEKMCFSADGSMVAVVRLIKISNDSSPKRQAIEIWKIEGNTPQTIMVTLSESCISQNVMRNDDPKIGDLCFCDDFWGHGKAIISLSTDGYIEIWLLDRRLFTTIDVLQQSIEILPPNANQTLSTEIATLEDEIKKCESFLKSDKDKRLRNSFEQVILRYKRELGRKNNLLQFYNNLLANRYNISSPIIRYYPQASALIYRNYNSVLIFRKNHDLSYVTAIGFTEFLPQSRRSRISCCWN